MGVSELFFLKNKAYPNSSTFLSAVYATKAARQLHARGWWSCCRWWSLAVSPMCKINNVCASAVFVYVSTQPTDMHLPVAIQQIQALWGLTNIHENTDGGRNLAQSEPVGRRWQKLPQCPEISAAFEPDGSVTGNILFLFERPCVRPLHRRHLGNSRRKADQLQMRK